VVLEAAATPDSSWLALGNQHKPVALTLAVGVVLVRPEHPEALVLF
jgi:hypothetical protein